MQALQKGPESGPCKACTWAVLHSRGNISLKVKLDRNREACFIQSFIYLFKILQVLLWHSMFDFLTNSFSHNGQEKTTSPVCFSFWCLLREAFSLNDFSQWSQLKEEKNGEWVFFRCCFRFRSKVKDFPHCSQMFPPDFWSECFSSIWRFMFSSLLNCLSQWVQEWCFSVGFWKGLYRGILWTSVMCLPKWSLEIDCWHFSHLIFEDGSGLLSSLLRCFKYSLTSVNLSKHFWHTMASLWTFSLWYLSDVEFENIFPHPAPSEFSHLTPFCFRCMYFSWCFLEPPVVNILLQNRHDRTARCLTSSSFGESSFSSLSSSLPWYSPSESVPWSPSSSSMLEMCEFSLPISTTAFLTGVSTLILKVKIPKLWAKTLMIKMTKNIK